MANLRNFINAITNDNRLYTAEDIGNMTSKEFVSNEKAIDYQMENLGIPRQNDLTNNSDVVYVHAYTKGDGTKVKAHYRSKQDGVVSDNCQNDGNNTDTAVDINPTLKFEGGITYNDYQLQPRTTIDDYPQVIEDGLIGAFNKNLLYVGINTYGKYKLKQDDAVHFWNIASKGLTQRVMKNILSVMEKFIIILRILLMIFHNTQNKLKKK